MRIQGIHTPGELKNYLINGAFDFWQERAGTTTTVNTASTVASYTSDMFLTIAFGPTTKNFSYGRDTDVPTVAQSGFQAPYSFLRTTITAQPTFAATDFIEPVQYRMEGNDYAKLHGKIATLSFWMKASVVGTYSVSFTNAAESRSYVTTVTQNVSNAWEYKSVTVPLEVPTVNYSFGNTNAFFIRIGALTGTNQSTSTLNQWQSGGFYMASTAVNHAATAGSTIRITQIAMTEGSQGFGSMGFQRAGKNIQDELAKCQRFYEKSYDMDVTPGSGTTLGLEAFVATTSFNRSTASFRVTKRATPTITIYGKGGASGVVERDSGTTAGSQSFSAWLNGFTTQAATHTASGEYTYQWVADARL